jgi:hypothetical protein
VQQRDRSIASLRADVTPLVFIIYTTAAYSHSLYTSMLCSRDTTIWTSTSYNITEANTAITNLNIIASDTNIIATVAYIVANTNISNHSTSAVHHDFAAYTSPPKVVFVLKSVTTRLPDYQTAKVCQHRLLPLVVSVQMLNE